MTQIASIRLDPKSLVSSIPISSGSLNSDHAWFKLHKANNTNDIADEGTGIFDTITIANNTDIDFTTKPNWLSLPTANKGNILVKEPSAAELAFLRTDTLNDGALILSAQVTIPDTSLSGTSCLFSFGHLNGPQEGSWAFQYAASRKVINKVVGPSDTTYGTTAPTIMALGSTHTIGMIIDTINNLILSYVDGIEDNSVVMVQPAALPDNNKFAIFGLSNAVAGASAGSSEIGEGDLDTLTTTMRDLFIIRVETDVSAHFNEIMSGFHNYPTEIPHVLKELGL